jgi:hypothetical protein
MCVVAVKVLRGRQIWTERFNKEAAAIVSRDLLTTGQKFNNFPPDNKIEALEVGY